MDYPFWDTGIGYGVLMAVISVVHVFISHFAIGGGLYLVVAETVARKRDDTRKLDYLQSLSKFFVLTTVVAGALTGVAIWFIIGLLNPAATEMLIHNFVWGWATEWTFFVIEIAAAILYLYGWKRLSAKNHLVVGWIYFGAAWMSLFIINGIIAFMLTPGDWIVTGNFWDGFFNPTFLPMLVLRTGVCIMLAGLVALVVAARQEPVDFRKRIVRYNALWGLLGLIIILPSLFWYWASIPEGMRIAAEDMMPLPMQSWNLIFWFGGILAVLFIIFGLIWRTGLKTGVAIFMMAVGLVWFGSFEWFRESIRKPYVVVDYMYGNATEVALTEDYREDGLLAHMGYRTGDDGADLFRHACRSCHTIDGYQALKPAFDGTDPEYIAGIIRGLYVLKGKMPPFLGTDAESELLATHIHGQVDQRHLGEIYGLSGTALGEKVYEVRCGRCHEMYGYKDLSASILGLSGEDISDLLDMAGDIAEEMPPFTGDETERQAFIEYIKFLSQEGDLP